jgi:hypothetical protein
MVSGIHYIFLYKGLFVISSTYHDDKSGRRYDTPEKAVKIAPAYLPGKKGYRFFCRQPIPRISAPAPITPHSVTGSGRGEAFVVGTLVTDIVVLVALSSDTCIETISPAAGCWTMAPEAVT